MNRHMVAVNAAGFRVGQDNPNAVLTDHEVELLLKLLDERAELIAAMKRTEATEHDIEVALREARLSFGALAIAFEVSKSQVRRIAKGVHRAQYPDHFKTVE